MGLYSYVSLGSVLSTSVPDSAASEKSFGSSGSGGALVGSGGALVERERRGTGFRTLGQYYVCMYICMQVIVY